MSNYAVTGDALTAIADAIRLKRDITDEISVADMPMQIGLIDGGGGASVFTVDINPTTNIGQTSDYIINHDLGVVPDLCIVYDVNKTHTDGKVGLCAYAIGQMFITSNNVTGYIGATQYTADDSIGVNSTMPTGAGSTGGMRDLTDSSVTFRRCNANGYMTAGRSYKAVFIKL